MCVIYIFDGKESKVHFSYGTMSFLRTKFVANLVKKRYKTDEARKHFDCSSVTFLDNNEEEVSEIYIDKNDILEIKTLLENLSRFDSCFEQSKNNFSNDYYKDILPSKGSYAFYKLVYYLALEYYEVTGTGSLYKKNEIPNYLDMPAKEKEIQEKLYKEYRQAASKRYNESRKATE